MNEKFKHLQSSVVQRISVYEDDMEATDLSIIYLRGDVRSIYTGIRALNQGI